MTLKMILFGVGSLAIVSCNSSEKSYISGNDVSGVYVREYAIDVTHPETGNNIGMRKIRDTIFIEPADNNYLISNRKWRINDYDQEGWVSMEHAEDRSMPTFFASYDETAKILNPTDKNISPAISIDNKKGKLFKGSSKDFEYLKIVN